MHERGEQVLSQHMAGVRGSYPAQPDPLPWVCQPFHQDRWHGGSHAAGVGSRPGPHDVMST